MTAPLLLAMLAAAPVAAAAGDDPPAATVNGRPLPRVEVHRVLADRTLRSPAGERLLEEFLSREAARREAERRGVEVPEEEVRAKVEEARRMAAEQMRRHGEAGEPSLEGFLRESGSSLAEFVADARYYLALQRMAREDLGTAGEVPVAQLDLWLRDLRRRLGVVTDPAALAEGEVARIGEEGIGREPFGRWLAGNTPPHEVLGVVQDLAFDMAVELEAAERGVSLEPAEIDAEVARLRREFESQPGIEGSGVTFAMWLREKRGLTLEEFRREPGFLSALLARRLRAASVTDERVAEEWRAHPERYGERARIRKILVLGSDRSTVFGRASRPLLEARRIADRALEEVQSGKSFEEVARRVSEDFPADGPRGQVFEVSAAENTTALPAPVLAAIFRAKPGETLGPLEAVNGYHIVRVEKRIPAPPFEAIRDRVRSDLESEAVRNWRLEFRSDPALVVHEDFRVR